MLMIKQYITKILYYFGYEIHKITPSTKKKEKKSVNKPPPINPVWPLLRKTGGLSNEEICQEFTKYKKWNYAYKFDDNLAFSTRHDNPDRFLQRFRHFMPYLIKAQNGSLQGKRVLDIACNSGFWSIQCALLGADVVGFDASEEHIEQANLIKSIVGIENVKFKVLDFWDMNPQTLDGTFDIVLNLGILFLLPKPLEALELTKAMARKLIVLDTSIMCIE